MKFKFCSDGDCPLWALAALHALGSLPAALFRAVLQHITDELPEDGIMDILKDTSLSSREEAARAAAAVRWVLRQAWRGGCAGSQLTRDLLVLGLPRAHAAALADAADDGREAYEARVRASGLTGECALPSVTRDLLGLGLPRAHAAALADAADDGREAYEARVRASGLTGECALPSVTRDLLGLGLPRAHAAALADAADDGREAYEARVRASGLTGECALPSVTRDLLGLGLPRAHAAALADAADDGREAYEARVRASGLTGECALPSVTRDLLGLGLPRAHAAALADAADDGREAYEARVRASGLTVNKLCDVTASPGPEGTIDTIKLSLHAEDLTGERNQSTVLVHKSQVNTLLKELKEAYRKMEDLDNVE